MRTGIIVEDDPDFRSLVSGWMTRLDFLVQHAESGAQARRILAESVPDVVVLDLNLPDESGLDVLSWITETAPEIATIMITAEDSVDRAVEAMRLGAIDYITKPVDQDEFNKRLDRLGSEARNRREISALRREVSRLGSTTGLIGDSSAMEEVRELVARVAPTGTSILVLGETGTGKEVLARTIHDVSDRADGPFVAINCAALPDDLIESELFGYEKGAFTSAAEAKQGLIELADGGTLFLDEIGDMPLAVQAKLLRVLEERNIQRLGATASRQIDVRVVAATHQDLQQMVGQGRFREDLFYRLNVVQLSLPPLRDRIGDIPVLARHFFQLLHHETNSSTSGISDNAMAALVAHAWPGNVRELRNVIERALIFARSDLIEREDLPFEIGSTANADSANVVDYPDNLADAVQLFEQRHIERIIDDCGGKRQVAAGRMGVDRSTLYRKMRQD